MFLYIKSEHDRYEPELIKAAVPTAWQQMEPKHSRTEPPAFSITTGVQWEEDHESSVSGSNQSAVHHT